MLATKSLIVQDKQVALMKQKQQPVYLKVETEHRREYVLFLCVKAKRKK